MISVGVEITSYLIKSSSLENDSDQKRLDGQFDNVRMSKGSHVFKLSSNTGFGLLTKDYSL